MAHGTARVISCVLTETVVKQPVPVSSGTAQTND